MLKRVKNGHCPQNNANSISNITVLTHDTQTHDLTVDQATRLRKDCKHQLRGMPHCSGMRYADTTNQLQIIQKNC